VWFCICGEAFNPGRGDCGMGAELLGQPPVNKNEAKAVADKVAQQRSAMHASIWLFLIKSDGQ
jgi:hypothetical protein